MLRWLRLQMTRNFVVALLLAVTMFGATNVYAQTIWSPGWTFENCQQIWWYERCWTVFVEDPTGDGLFETMYAVCQAFGLCP